MQGEERNILTNPAWRGRGRVAAMARRDYNSVKGVK
jgi:hypothetical protein